MRLYVDGFELVAERKTGTAEPVGGGHWLLSGRLHFKNLKSPSPRSHDKTTTCLSRQFDDLARKTFFPSLGNAGAADEQPPPPPGSRGARPGRNGPDQVT